MTPPPPEEFTLMYANNVFKIKTSKLKDKSAWFRSYFQLQWAADPVDLLEVPYMEVVSVESYRSFLSYIHSGKVDFTLENSFPLYHLGWHYKVSALLEAASCVVKQNIKNRNWFKTVSKQVTLVSDVNFMEQMSTWLEPLLSINSSSIGVLDNSTLDFTPRERRYIENQFQDLEILFTLTKDNVMTCSEVVIQSFHKMDKVCLVLKFQNGEACAIVQDWPNVSFKMSLNRSSFGHRDYGKTVEPCSIVQKSDPFNLPFNFFDHYQVQPQSTPHTCTFDIGNSSFYTLKDADRYGNSPTWAVRRPADHPIDLSFLTSHPSDAYSPHIVSKLELFSFSSALQR
ncbi:hypothetical protein RCL1_005105 [Eukaryota sp. TZLM3-RCL]